MADHAADLGADPPQLVDVLSRERAHPELPLAARRQRRCRAPRCRTRRARRCRRRRAGRRSSRSRSRRRRRRTRASWRRRSNARSRAMFHGSARARNLTARRSSRPAVPTQPCWTTEDPITCATGCSPDACASAYSLAVRSLVKNGVLAVATRFRRSSAPSGIPPCRIRSRSTSAARRSSSVGGLGLFLPNGDTTGSSHSRNARVSRRVAVVRRSSAGEGVAPPRVQFGG